MTTLCHFHIKDTPKFFCNVWFFGKYDSIKLRVWNATTLIWLLQAKLSSGLLMASVIGLYLTIITHLVFSELRNLPGLNLLAMNTNMVLYQQLFLGTIHILRQQVLGHFFLPTHYVSMIHVLTDSKQELTFFEPTHPDQRLCTT